MALEGDLCRGVIHEDEESGTVTVCRQPVPSGALTYSAINSPTGYYLMLCTECRAAMAEDMAPYMAAAVSRGQMTGAVTELPEGVLMSEEEMREVLREREGPVSNKGPLGKERRIRAVRYKHGDKCAEYVANHLQRVTRKSDF